MVGMNDILNSFFQQMVNYTTLNADVLNAMQIIIDIISVGFSAWILIWFLSIPLKLLRYRRTGVWM